MPYPIPASLTVTRWNASKSIFDKVTQQHTGMATQLTDMARAAERVNADILLNAESLIDAILKESDLRTYEQQLQQEVNDLRGLTQEANQTLTLVSKVLSDISNKGSQQHKTHMNTMKTDATNLVRGLMLQTTTEQQRRVARLSRRREALQAARELRLSDVLSRPNLKELFSKFAVKESFVENFSFLTEDETTPKTLRMAKKHRRIYIIRGAPRELNISGRLRSTVISLVDICDTLSIGEDMNLEIILKKPEMLEAAATAIEEAKLIPMPGVINLWQRWDRTWDTVYKEIYGLTAQDPFARFVATKELIVALED